MAEKHVYFFGGGKAEGSKEMRAELGGKGCNLAEMTNIGLPVPPGFTIDTTTCIFFYKNNNTYPEGLEKEVVTNLERIEKLMGKKFGDPENPLLLSCRSGAPISMPGMMDTVLNIGLNDDTIKGLVKNMGERPAYDSYRRFLQMFGDVVLEIRPETEEERDPFDLIIEEIKEKKGIELDVDLSVDDLKDIVEKFKQIIKKETGEEFPQDPMKQLWMAIDSVFESWNIPRAINYRRINNISDDLGTAVNVQVMVFGNFGFDSGSGVGFTRNPSTGEKELYGDYLLNAQGEDVVAGIRTPHNISDLQDEMPDIYDELLEISDILDKHFLDMQDFEFTIETDKLYILQTRDGKRTGLSAIKIALDFYEEGLITEDEAMMRLEPEQLNHLLKPIFDPKEIEKAKNEGRFLAKGLNAGPGAATGKLVFTADDAVEWARNGEKVILTRWETSPDDIHGMASSIGILTARGGMTSHAALVARQMGKIAVTGCGALNINYKKKQLQVNGTTLKEGDWISLDGFTGEVFKGKIATSPSEVEQVLIEKSLKEKDAPMYQLFKKVSEWVDTKIEMGVRANADRPDEAQIARDFGAIGIGLCRTEHMFREPERLIYMQQMILAENHEEREKALKHILPFQRDDFYELFKVMEGLPITIRTLDPPLHEFLPDSDDDIKELSQELNVPQEKIKEQAERLDEENPMLGTRGCRLGILYPEITEMQAKAILEAASKCINEGIEIYPEIMIPLVGNVKELKLQADIVHEVAEEVAEETGVKVDYTIGTMIEIPRAAITANEIAEDAEFFSFGTNDLTQTLLGISRDDAGRFLAPYLEKRIYNKNPFESIDIKGVGEIMEMAVDRGRNTNKNIKIGICGEHGGDPDSVNFCFSLGLDYVSCSPFRIPIARLASAQSSVKIKDN
jgi:pyruvate,orthophosphate dikinase